MEQEDQRYTPGQVTPVISSLPFGSLAAQAYETLYGAGTWYRANIQRPVTSFLNQAPPNLATGFAVGVANAPNIPIDAAAATAAGVPFVASRPAEFPRRLGQGLGMQYEYFRQGITERPAEFAGEMFGTALIMHGVGKAARAVSPVRPEALEFPTGRTVKNPYYSERAPIVNRLTGAKPENPVVTRYTGLVRDNQIARAITKRPDWEGARPLAGVLSKVDEATGKRTRQIVVGDATRAYGTTRIGSGYMPETPAEYAVARPVMESRLSGADLAVFREGLNFKRKLMQDRINTPVIEKYGSIPPRGMTQAQWTAVQEYTAANAGDVMPYGSTVGRSFFGRFMRSNIGDFDADIRPKLVTKHSEGYFEAMAKPEGWAIKKYPDPKRSGKFIYEATDTGGRQVATMKYQGSQLTGGRYVATDPAGQTLLDLHPYYPSEWNANILNKVKAGIKRDEWTPVQQGKIRTVPAKYVPMGKIQFFLEGGYVETTPGIKAVIRGMVHRHKDAPDISHSARYFAGVEFKEALTDMRRGRYNDANTKIRSGHEYLKIADAYRDYVKETVRKGELNPEALEFLNQADDPVGKLRNIQEVKIRHWNEEATLGGTGRQVSVPKATEDILNSSRFRDVISRASRQSRRQATGRQGAGTGRSGSVGDDYGDLIYRPRVRAAGGSSASSYLAPVSSGGRRISGISSGTYRKEGQYQGKRSGPSSSPRGASPERGGKPSPTGSGGYTGGGGSGPSPTGGGDDYKRNPGGPYMGPPPIPPGPDYPPNPPPPSEIPRDRTRTRTTAFSALPAARKRLRKDEDLLVWQGDKVRTTAPFLEMAPVASHLELLKGVTNAKRHRRAPRKFI